MQTTVKLYAFGYRELRTYLAAALFVVGNIVLPQLAHLIPQGGVTWLPIYFFTLIGAYKYGWRVGLLTAVASPLLNSWLFGMPAPQVLPAILMKSVVLAVAAGFAARRFRAVTLPLMLAFALLWLGCMALLTAAARDELELKVNSTVNNLRRDLQTELELHLERLEGDSAEYAGDYLRSNLSWASMRLTGIGESAMALLVSDGEGGQFRSQLAWGSGYEDGFSTGRLWYFWLDEGLDDEGQLAFARWLTDMGASSALTLDADGTTAVSPSSLLGCTARVTGFAREGYSLDVRKIEIVGPGGELVSSFETSMQGVEPVTVELRYLQAASVLLSSSNGEGYSNSDMERRLENFREAQAIIDRDLAGEARSVLKGGGSLRSNVNSSGMTSLISAQTELGRAAVESELFTYLSTFILSALVALGLAAYLSWKVTGPVEELCRGAESGRCPEDGPVTELNALASAFNGAQERLAGQLEREREFTRSAAHELKTPLAILRTHAEALREDIAAEKRGQYLDIVLDESDRMTRLVAQLLELSRFESGAPAAKEPLELDALVREVWEPLGLAVRQRGLRLTLELQPVRLEGDRERLKQAVGNLASNALRHCAAGGEIRVGLRAEGGEAVLTVYNDGEQIAGEDLPHLFEAFYRGDKSRSRESGGTGLGLAIARAAAESHGGRCEAENRGRGVSFRIYLPLGH